MSDFRWPRPLGTDPSKRDHSKNVSSTKQHGTTTETCGAPLFGRKAHKAGHLKQYLRSDAGGRDTSKITTLEPPGPSRPKVINYINGGPSDEEYDSKRKKVVAGASVRERINSIRPGITGGGPPHRWDNHFPTSRPHPDIAAAPRRPHHVPRNRRLRRETHPGRPGSSADLVQASVVSHMGHSLRPRKP
ncbi:hypothetical protein CK203_095634 [Vitis vinifera]|uniref:Uncharacterized protein n=1 Tax=Vitis vinifera TaxID=29760 RepID=A0A438EMQ2_VITVI|nr:hypothetical protein CK203_095634 [Vitis vinifera]